MKCLNDFFSNIKSNGINNVGSGFDNVLASLPAIILMPLMINSSIGVELFDLSFIIFLSGINTFLFLIFTRGQVPCCLGSSFAFINVTVSMYKLLSKEIQDKSEILSYIMGAYICSGLLLIFLSIIAKIVPKKYIDIIIPPAVLGPAISLIGLELSGQAIDQTGFNSGTFGSEQGLALLTILIVIAFSLIKRKKFNNTSISLAILIAIALCYASPHIEQITKWNLSSWDMPDIGNLFSLGVPKFQLIIPKLKINCFLMMIPSTLILFCECTARRIMIDNLLENLSSEPRCETSEENSIKKGKIMNKIKFGLANGANGILNSVNPIFNGVPTTIYAESTAVMRINKNINILQFVFASILLVAISFLNGAIFLINNMPKPIIGGVSLVLMGIIAVPGLKILVDKKIDYNKLSNLFLSASVLLVGMSDISITIFNTEIKGMGLGLVCGIALNLIVKILQRIKLLKDDITYMEIYEMCQKFSDVNMKNKDINHVEFRTNDNTYVYLETQHNKIYCNVIVENQFYEQHKNDKHLEKTNDIGDNLVRCFIDVDSISKESDLVQMIENSYVLCEKIDHEKSIFSCLSDKCLPTQKNEEQAVRT